MAINNNADSLTDVIPSLSTKLTVLKGLRYFLLGLGVLGVIVSLIIHSEHRLAQEEVGREHLSRLNLLKFIMTHDLEIAAADVHLLVESDLVRKFVKDPNDLHVDLLSSRIRGFLTDRQIYCQARVLDNDGFEVVRVDRKNGVPVVLPEEKLQYKGDRYYFRGMQELADSELYVSPLDLNVENGEIQVPYLPVLRIGQALSDKAGKRLGFLILNLHAQELIDRYVQAYGVDRQYIFSMLNSDGYWLRNQNREKEWGGELDHGHSLPNASPELWQELQARKSGQLSQGGSLISFETLFPQQLINLHSTDSNTKKGVAEETAEEPGSNFWYLVLESPGTTLSYAHLLSQHPWVFLVISILVLFVLALSCFIAIVGQKKESREQVVKMLTLAVEQSPGPVIITEIDGTIKYANKKFEQMTGYLRQNLIGKNPRVLKSGKTPSAVYRSLWQTVLGGQEWRGEFENKTRENDAYYVDANIAPLVDDKGSIVRIMGLLEDITEKKNLQKKLNTLATTDELTGVLNRRAFLNSFTKEIERQKRYGQPLTILYLDMDHFKRINDTYGHHAGDRVLIHASKTVTSQLRESDSFGRIGGEEFAALLVSTDSQGGEQLAERIRQEVEGLVVRVDGNEIQCTISVGCTSVRENDNVDEVYKRADRALYTAKEKGRNRVVFLR